MPACFVQGGKGCHEAGHKMLIEGLKNQWLCWDDAMQAWHTRDSRSAGVPVGSGWHSLSCAPCVQISAARLFSGVAPCVQISAAWLFSGAAPCGLFVLVWRRHARNTAKAL